MKVNKFLIAIVLGVLGVITVKAQTLNPTYKLTTAGEADNFFGGYTFSYRAAGTPWNGALISYGGFDNTYDTQLSSSYEHNRISFRTRNGDDKVWNAWRELATKGSNDFIGNQSIEGNLGIGTTSANNLLEVSGHHEDSRILLHSHGNGSNTGQADLMLWASEPGITWTGVGIGNNVRNFKEGVARTSLLNPARGGSYIRLLDCSMSFNVLNSGGLDKQAITINNEGNIGIGTTNPDSKLTVAGKIHAQEVKVTINAGSVPDYVFANDYKLKSLQEVEDYIKQNSHLPEIPSATEIEKNGLMLAEMNLSLLKKIEELTLYMIEQNKKIEQIKKENESFKTVFERLSKIEQKLK